MSNQPSVRAACEGKRRYPTYRQALRSLELPRVGFLDARVWKHFVLKRLGICHCDYCGGFHAGHSFRARPVDLGALQPRRGYELPNPPA